MTHLIVTHEDDDVDEFRFDSNYTPISLGRRTTNDVCIASPSVSGNHAKITLDADGAWIEDLSSTNGTFINGRLISRRRLEHGDDIAIGKARVTWLGWTEGASAPDAASGTEATEAEAEADDAADESEDDPLKPYAERLATRPEPAGTADDAPEQRRRFDDLFDADESSGSSGPHVEPRLAPEESADALDTAVAARPIATPASTEPAAGNPEPSAAATEFPVEQPEEPDSPAAESSSEQPSVAARADRHAAEEAHPLDDMQEVVSEDDTSEDALFEASLGKAELEIRNGAKSGQTLAIDKPVTTLGRPGIQIAAIMRKPDGYFLMHVESDESAERPTLNNDAIGDDPVPLRSGDELRVAGVDVQFTLS